jgi:thiamine pyrophosphate-dependent acetolactate synthase large subunit-like protein
MEETRLRAVVAGGRPVTSVTTDAPRVCDALADELVASGVRTVFGLMGEDTASLVTALAARDVEVHAARHENVAITMADGYAWAGDTLGVCIISRGPGATNGLTAAISAVRAGRPLLLVAGEAPSQPGPGPDLKELDHALLARAAGLVHARITAGDDATSVLREAISVARSARPVLLTVQADVFHGAAAPAARHPAPPPEESRKPPAPAARDVDALAALLRDARRPLLLAGAGAVASGAAPAIARLADRTGALVGTTLKAKDLFRGAPWDVGVVGGFTNPVRRPLLEEVDCVLAFGASLSSLTTARGALFAGVPFAQIDVDDRRLGAITPITTPVVGDARATAEALLAVVPDSPPGGDARFHTAETRARLALEPEFQPTEPRPDSMDPQALVRRLDTLLHPDRTVVADGGHHAGFPAMYLPVAGPWRWLYTLDFAAVGMGLGSALGVAAARPGSPTVLFIGDGGLSMTLGDLATVAAQQPSLVIVVMNDRAWGAERHFLDLLGLPHAQAQLPDVDFAAVAAGLGIAGARIRSLGELDAHADRLAAATGAPLVLDCHIHADLRARWMDEF